MNAGILGIGWVSAKGHGQGMIASLDDFRPSSSLPAIKSKDIGATGNPRFGRLDRFSKTGFAAISLAVKNADLTSLPDSQSTGLIAVTNHGCSATDIKYYNTVIPEQGKLASPNQFAYTLSSSFLGEAAIAYNLQGENLVLNGDKEVEQMAINLALINLFRNNVNYMIVGVNNTWFPERDNLTENQRMGSVFLVLCKETPKDRQPLRTLVWKPADMDPQSEPVRHSVYELCAENPNQTHQ